MLTNKLTNDKDYGQLRSHIFHVVVVEKWVNDVRLSDKATRGTLFIKATSLQVSALLPDFPAKKEKKKKSCQKSKRRKRSNGSERIEEASANERERYSMPETVCMYAADSPGGAVTAAATFFIIQSLPGGGESAAQPSLSAESWRSGVLANASGVLQLGYCQLSG